MRPIGFILKFMYFGPWAYLMGSTVIALVSPLVRLSVFKYLGNCSLVFSNFLHEVSAHKGTKVTEPDF